MRKFFGLGLALTLVLAFSAETHASYRPAIIATSIGTAALVATAVLGSLTARKFAELQISYNSTTLVAASYKTTKTNCEVCGTIFAASTGCTNMDYTSQILCSYSVWQNGTARTLQTPTLKMCGSTENDAEQAAQSACSVGSTLSDAWYQIANPSHWSYSLRSLNPYVPYTIVSAGLSVASLGAGLVLGIKEKWRRTYGSYETLP